MILSLMSILQGKVKLLEKKQMDISGNAPTKYINTAYVPKPQHVDRWEAAIKVIITSAFKVFKVVKHNIYNSF